MKVHLRQIPQGETIHIEGQESAEPLGLEEAGAHPVTQLFYSLEAGVSSGSLIVTGSLEISVRLECVACLREFERTLSVNDFTAQIDIGGREAIDLTPQAREDIFLVLPVHPRCDAEGATECPAKFQSVPATPLSAEHADRSEIWNALDSLKPKQN